MLIVTRKEGESVIINDNVEVVVVSVEGGKIRLGFNAPASVQIYRKEIFDKIQQANRDAAANKSITQLPKINEAKK
jgi:carbon storage regulator